MAQGHPAPMVTVQLQLDYYMSAQFAGVALACELGLYEDRGLAVSVLPDCPPGEEPQHVLKAQADDAASLCVGSIEQNVLVPYVSAHGTDHVVACGAMFGRSPLCIAALPGVSIETAGKTTLVIGAHEDTVQLLQHLAPAAKVVCVPREDKLKMLKDRKIDAVQIYDCTESITLSEALGEEGALQAVPFEELSRSAELGYAQVLFTTAASLAPGDPRRDAMHRFMQATFEGWRRAIADPEAAAAAVLARQPAQIDHFLSTREFVLESVRRSCAYVKRTSAGADRLGVIDPQAWASANAWLGGALTAATHPTGPLLDSTLWAADSLLMLGTPLASKLLREAKRAAAEALDRHCRRPTLCVVTVGEEPLGATHDDARRRLELIGVPGASWFDKSASARAIGIEVEELHVPTSTSTAQLCSLLRDVCERVDGVQLMWPLPRHIDAAECYAEIPLALDVDGAHWLAQRVAGGGERAATRELTNAPVTAAAVLRLLDEHGEGETLAGKRVLIVGRSRLCGAPLAFMFGARGALVTAAHSQATSAQLREACLQADILVACVGKPGLIQADWISPGAVVVNVGTTFDGERLLPDIPSELGELRHCKRVASCPNGVGPLSVAVLLEQTAQSALGRAPKPIGAEPTTPALSEAALGAWVAAHAPWELRSSSLLNPCVDSPVRVLSRSFHFASYPSAVRFVAEVSSASEAANHHPNLSVVHSCSRGVDVLVELFTYATKGLTAFDTAAAEAIAALCEARSAAAAH